MTKHKVTMQLKELNLMSSNAERVLLASAARTTTQTVADQYNARHRGVVISLSVSAITATPSLVVTIEGKDANGKYYTLLTSAAVTTVSDNQYTVYPGVTTANNVAASNVLPKTWRVKVTAGDSDSATYALAATLLV